MKKRGTRLHALQYNLSFASSRHAKGVKEMDSVLLVSYCRRVVLPDYYNMHLILS
jgi:hypothetical protein